MGPKQITQELLARWHGNDSVDTIAADLNIARNVVLNAWREFKATGMLPKGDRPRSRQSFMLRGENHSDGRPAIDRDYDPLLAALKEGKR